jgi:mono/diheme cytochrome c family protein
MPASPAVKADMSLPLPMQLVGQAARGRKFYNDNCATCHGVKGDAQGPRAYFIRPKPRNFLTADSRAQFNRPALFAGISMGRVGSEMPAWNKVISEQQIADLTEYVFQSFIRPEAGPRR